MATLNWNLTRSDGVTLVEVVVTSETTEQVRIESALTPVWPPRRQGVPVPGWDGPTFDGTVEPDAPLVVGYASPAAPVDPPATVTDAPAEDGAVSPRTLVRALGDAAPPRDAVPAGEHSSCGDSPDNRSPVDNEGSSATAAAAPNEFEWGPDRQQAAASESESEPDAEKSLAAVHQRLSTLEERLDAVEATAGPVESR